MYGGSEPQNLRARLPPWQFLVTEKDSKPRALRGGESSYIFTESTCRLSSVILPLTVTL